MSAAARRRTSKRRKTSVMAGTSTTVPPSASRSPFTPSALVPAPELAEELLYGLGGLGMLGHRTEELRRDRDDVGARLHRLVHVLHVPDASHDDLAGNAPLTQHPDGLGDHGPRVVAEVADPVVEEAHVVGTGQRRHLG